MQRTKKHNNELKNHKLEKTLKQKAQFPILGSVHKLTKKTDKVIRELQNHNKLIRLANRSAAGWMTVQE